MAEKNKTGLIKGDSFENDYQVILTDFMSLLEQSRRLTARSINSIMTATYWEIGRRIVEVEQKSEKRKDYYGEKIIDKLANDLTKHFGRGFSKRNLFQMRSFYLAYGFFNTDHQEIMQTTSALSLKKENYLEKIEVLSAISQKLKLPWSHYVLLLSCKNKLAREFYEIESLRGGWTVRQLKRQINSKFYERTALAKDKAKMLKDGEKALPEDFVSPEEEIKDSFVLEFLNIKDDYSELKLEEALIKHLENFLLELGTGFTFIGRQKRLRIGDEWYRVDLVFYHRRLRCLVIIDLKLGKLSHSDIGQMLLYTGYADKHWRMENENPPIGLILCDQKNEALAHYTLESLPNKILASEYKMFLPDEEVLAEEIRKTRQLLEGKLDFFKSK